MKSELQISLPSRISPLQETPNYGIFFFLFLFVILFSFFVVAVWGRGLSGGVFFHNFSPHQRTLSGIGDKYISNDIVCTSAKDENAKIKGTAEN